MARLLLVTVILALCAAGFALAPRIRPRLVGAFLLACAAAVFAARLGHEGPYPFPTGQDLRVASACLLGGVFLVGWGARAGSPRWLVRTLVTLTPVLFVMTAAAVAHEVEEVVVLRTPDAQGDVLGTRLWVVDHEGAPWVVTGRASEHVRRLREIPRIELDRGGARSCRLAEVHGDRATIETILRKRHEKYRTQRLAVALGFWSGSMEGIEEIATAVRLAPCAEAAR